LYALLDLGLRGARPIALTRLLALAVEIFLVGFVGTQRVWFLRKARGVRLWPQEVWTISWRFFGRFLCLGLLSGIVFAVVLVPVVVATAHQVGSTTSVTTTVPAGLTAALIAVSFVLDVVLTFVVPALSLTTRSVTTSLRLGWRVMSKSWPTSLWYLFAPGITLLALTGALPHSVISTEASVVLGLFSTLLGLWFKGANVAFYIRSVPPPSVDGAA
jgi:hypothetical protein